MDRSPEESSHTHSPLRCRGHLRGASVAISGSACHPRVSAPGSVHRETPRGGACGEGGAPSARSPLPQGRRLGHAGWNVLARGWVRADLFLDPTFTHGTRSPASCPSPGLLNGFIPEPKPPCGMSWVPPRSRGRRSVKHPFGPAWTYRNGHLCLHASPGAAIVQWTVTDGIARCHPLPRPIHPCHRAFVVTCVCTCV